MSVIGLICFLAFCFWLVVHDNGSAKAKRMDQDLRKKERDERRAEREARQDNRERLRDLPKL